jgi:hypothetical protein
MTKKTKNEETAGARVVTPDPKDVKRDPEMAKNAAAKKNTPALQSDDDDDKKKKVGPKGPLRMGLKVHH